MRYDPIDFDSPLGISKREWARVLGANLALLLLAYTIALILTISGNDLFLLRFYNEQLNGIESMLMNHDLFWVFQIPVAAIEEVIICAYAAKRKPSIFVFLSYCGVYYAICTIIYFTTKVVPGFMTLLLGVVFVLGYCAFFSIKNKDWRYGLKCLARFAIATAISLALNEAVSVFRTKVYNLWELGFDNSFYIALTIEYDLALALSLGLLTILIPWEKGERQAWKSQDAGGSSPTSKRWSLKNSPKKNKPQLSPKALKRLRLLKAKVIVIQTVALAVIAFVPIMSGRGIEFSLLYISFCLTRVILGFSHSLHFKSELACVTIGALTFWGLTFLAPSAEASIILSLAYGAGLALGFRLYWELHDLMMYRRAAKTDRYAMLYTAFKGNTDPRHIRGVMRLRGHNDEDEIKMVQMYMAREKVDYISQWLNVPLRTVDRKLTEIADELYSKR